MKILRNLAIRFILFTVTIYALSAVTVDAIGDMGADGGVNASDNIIASTVKQTIHDEIAENQTIKSVKKATKPARRLIRLAKSHNDELTDIADEAVKTVKANSNGLQTLFME